jgi:hypothetical protein
MRGLCHKMTIQPDTILEWTGHTAGVFSVQVCVACGPLCAVSMRWRVI